MEFTNNHIVIFILAEAGISIDIIQRGLTIKFIKVKVANTGTKTLTGMKAMFGKEDIVEIGTLEPRESVWITPEDPFPDFVKVISAERVETVKMIQAPKYSP